LIAAFATGGVFLFDVKMGATPAEGTFFVREGEMQISNSSEIVTVTEVAALLRCSKAHVCNAINGKVRGVTPLPAIPMGRRKLIRLSALTAWLAANEPSHA
jgi:hypothetical protein